MLGVHHGGTVLAGGRGLCDTLFVHLFVWTSRRWSSWSGRSPRSMTPATTPRRWPRRRRRRHGCGRGSTGATCRSPRASQRSMRCAEQALARAGRTSTRDVNRVVERVSTTNRVPELGASLSAGAVSAGHVDVVGDVLRSCEPAVRDVLASEGAWIARRAAALTPQELRRELGAEVRQLETDGGMARLERQRRACRVRSWVDRDGMWCFHGSSTPRPASSCTSGSSPRPSSCSPRPFPPTRPTTRSNARGSCAPMPWSPWSTATGLRSGCPRSSPSSTPPPPMPTAIPPSTGDCRSSFPHACCTTCSG